MTEDVLSGVNDGRQNVKVQAIMVSIGYIYSIYELSDKEKKKGKETLGCGESIYSTKLCGAP